MAESAEGRAPGPGLVPRWEAGGLGSLGVARAPRRGRHGRTGACHVAQEMAALCSLAFMRSAAMLEVLRSGSPLSS